MSSLLITGGTIVTATDLYRGDVFVDGDKISVIGTALSIPADRTIDVVPPKAAAIVPDSKSSADVVPPNGMSRWVCTSRPPGST